MTQGRPRVLLVDDIDDNLCALEAILRPLDLVLVRASSGEEAMKAVLRDDFALILMDVVMPGLSGHELVQKLLPARPGTKVLYLSGYAEDAFASPLPADGKRIFLQKPFTLQSLSRRVREVLGPATHKFL